MIVRLLLSGALGLVTTYTVAVIPPNRPASPNSIRTDFKRAGPTDFVADGFTPIRQRSRWRDLYYKGYYDDPDRGLVATVPSPDQCRRMLRRQTYSSRPFGRCGTGDPRTSSYHIEEWGWPLRCTWSWWRHDGDTGYTWGNSFNFESSTPRQYPWVQPELKLPYGIIWSGLGVNTAIFGAPWLAVLMAPLAVRSLRRKRGHCTACGYDLRGLPDAAPCPECGSDYRSQPPGTSPRALPGVQG